jgi:ADP-ribose pyrophosphatase YjhB (NUDIX family)
MKIRAAGLIVYENTILMVKHVKNTKAYWMLPGGGIELGERVKEALRRELKEEINLDATVKEMAFVVESIHSPAKHIIQPTFRVEIREVNEIRVGNDLRVRDFAFFHIQDFDGITLYPDVKDICIEFLKTNSCNRKYYLRKWLN